MKNLRISANLDWHILKQKINNFFNKKEIVITKKIWKNSFFFILLSFLNVSLPIYICLITSKIDEFGSYATVGIGFITSFQLAYSQIGFAFAIFAGSILFQKTYRNQFFEKGNIYYHILFVALIYGVCTVPLYIGPTYIYTKFANEHINTIDSLQPAYSYIYSSCGFVLLTSFSASLIIVLYTYKRIWHAVIEIILGFVLVILISCLLGYLTPLKYTGVGLGLTLGTLISTIILLIHTHIATRIFKNKIRLQKQYFKIIFTNVWRQTLVIISIQIFKSVALIMLSYQIPNKLIDAVPLNYQMSRLIWYNILYLIPFLTSGLTDSIYYFFSKYEKNTVNVNVKVVAAITTTTAFILTIIISIISSYLIQPLASFYIQNQAHTYSDSEILNNLNQLSKDKILNVLTANNDIPQNLKNNLLNLINSSNPAVSDIYNQVINIIVEKILKPQFTTFDANKINDLINLPNSFTLIYVSVYCIMYPLGMLMNAFLLASKKEKSQAILIVIVQGLFILFIVEFGIGFQETQRFYLMEAWSFPLTIVGIIVFIYMVINFLTRINHKKIKNKQHHV